jgi:hypothetical protein
LNILSLRVAAAVAKITVEAVVQADSVLARALASPQVPITRLPLVVVEARQQGQPQTPLEEAVAILYLAPSLPLAAAVAAAKEP